MAERGERIDVTQHGLAKAGNFREEIRPVKRFASKDVGMIRREFCSEIKAFFPVRLAGSEFTADGKISTPRAAASRHGNLHLCRFALVEKLAAQGFQQPAQRLVDAVTNDIEKAGFLARCSYLFRNLCVFDGAIHQRADINHRNMRKLGEIHTHNYAMRSCLWRIAKFGLSAVVFEVLIPLPGCATSLLYSVI